jgi:hypothetical protein
MTPDSTNPYADFLSTWGLAGVVSLIVTADISLRGWYRDRSHLWLMHNEDTSEQFFVRASGVRTETVDNVIGTTTLIISNNGARPNAIIRWHATVRDVHGTTHEINMRGGDLTVARHLSCDDRSVPHDFSESFSPA